MWWWSVRVSPWSCVKEDLTYFGKPVGEGDISSEHSMMREDWLLGKKATHLFTGRGFCVLLWSCLCQAECRKKKNCFAVSILRKKDLQLNWAVEPSSLPCAQNKWQLGPPRLSVKGVNTSSSGLVWVHPKMSLLACLPRRRKRSPTSMHKGTKTQKRAWEDQHISGWYQCHWIPSDPESINVIWLDSLPWTHFMAEHMTWFPGTCHGSHWKRRNCALFVGLNPLGPGPTHQAEGDNHTQLRYWNTKWSSQCLLIAIKCKIIALFQTNAAIKTKQQPNPYTWKSSFKNPEKETWCKERRHLEGLINESSCRLPIPGTFIYSFNLAQ